VKLGVAGDPIFGFPDPDLPLHYNFHRVTVTIKGSLPESIAIVEAFLVRKLAQNIIPF